MQNTNLRTIGAAVVLAGLVVAGVSQVLADRDTTEPEIVAPASTTTTFPATSAPSTQPEPFVYRVGVLSGITTDNFWAFYGREPSVWNSYVLGPTKPALFTSISASGSLERELALEMPDPAPADDGWSVMVDLDSRFKWSDGEAITAHDLAFTFETVRALDLKGSWAEAFPSEVSSIEAEDDHRAHIEFTKRPSLSVWPQGVGLAPIMPGHVWSGVVDDITRKELYGLEGSVDLGGGPLALESVTDDLIVSTANSGYPTGGVPDTVEYHIFASEAEAVEALADGEIDTVLSPKGLTAESAKALQANAEVKTMASPGNGVRYLGFNLDRDPMAAPEFRSALAMLLERETLAESLPNAGPVARSLVPAANRRWFDVGSAEEIAALYEGPLPERLDSAIEGLKSVGYEWDTPPGIDGGDLVAGEGLTIDGRAPQPLTILTPGDEYDPARPEYAAEIATVLGIFGFDARPVVTDFDTVVDLAFSPDDDGSLHYDMYLLGWTLGNPAMPDYYAALFATDGPLNNTGYDSREFTKALEAYESASTRQKALDALWDMERALATDLPYLLLYSNEITEAFRSDRVSFDVGETLGGLQARLGGIYDVSPVD